MTYKANRDGVAERCADPAVHKRIAVDLTRIGHDDELRRDVELTLVKAAKHHDANTLSLWPTVPGSGKILRLVRLDDISDIKRCPRVQAFASDCRLVKCAKASHGKRSGSSGTKIGKAHLTWACSEAAVLCLRDHPAGQKLLARWEKKHGTGKALTIVAHQRSRAVYSMLKRHVALNRQRFLNDEGRGGGEPDASLDHQGRNLRCATLDHASITASLNASARLGHDP
jgi:transposase